MVYLGIDYGTKRIGVAASDDGGRVAFAAGYIDAKRGLRAMLEEVLKLHPAEVIVVGNPLKNEGGPGDLCGKTWKLAVKLEGWFGVKCVLWDERFTSVQGAQSPCRRRSPGDDDQAAAVIILQSYLDYINSGGGAEERAV